MRKYNIALLPGDGVGPEVTKEAEKVLRSVQQVVGGFEFDFQEYYVGNKRYLEFGEVLPEQTFQDCKAADAILMGAIGLPKAGMKPVTDKSGTEVTGHLMFKLRFDLELFAGVRPIKSFPGVPSALCGKDRKIDMIILRESTEGLFSSYGGGGVVNDVCAYDTQIITRMGTERVSRYAFELAKGRQGRPADGRKLVTCTHKGNVFRSFAYMTKVFNEIAEEYKDEVSSETTMIDAITLLMTQYPENYDVIVAENAHGDIISDMAAAYVGGMGMAPSGDIGYEHGLFQPSHGSGPSIAGKGIANPTATILSGKMMLEWLGRKNDDPALLDAARRIDQAVYDTFMDGVRTADVSGTASTADFGAAVIRNLEKH
ncbi:MAG: isocitrate/isopropylmalate dehydrogenase family protein [Sphaerochaetaceae bacterium]|nr:isocitrate/isopropylmalate dehydrogenase family protein [Sphaerochaetaceae bacterium]